MSLQSRLDIICDEADADLGSGLEVGREASDDISTEKPVSQLVLHLVRSATSNNIFDPFPMGIFQFSFMKKH